MSLINKIEKEITDIMKALNATDIDVSISVRLAFGSSTHDKGVLYYITRVIYKGAYIVNERKFTDMEQMLLMRLEQPL